MIKLAQTKIEDLVERNKKLKWELEKYMKLVSSLKRSNQRRRRKSLGKEQEGEEGVDEDDDEEVSRSMQELRDKLKLMEVKLLETSEALAKERSKQVKLREELAKAQEIIDQLKDGEEGAGKMEQVGSGDAVLMAELKERHRAEILKTTASYEKELLKLKEMVSRAMMMNSNMSETRSKSASI
jgi:hypothetical protein